uniref:ORF2 n=1 Tax=Crocidura shantungensis ribovirus 12 TaxID=3139532 RepID=A0AB38ZJV9_9VIRU
MREESNKKWETSERKARQDWQSGESQRQREWQGEQSRMQQHWQTKQNDLDRQWKTWNAKEDRSFREGQLHEQFGQQEKMQGNMFQQQEKMLRLDYELRGYTTPGAVYGGNAAGGAPSTRPSAGTQTTSSYSGSFVRPKSLTYSALTPGVIKSNNEGLGFGTPRSQARIFANSNSSTTVGTQSGTSAEMLNENTPIQPFEHTNSGPARNIQPSVNVISNEATSSKPVMSPASHTTTIGPGGPKNATSGIASGFAKNQQIAEAGAEGGPMGALMAGLAQESESQQRMGKGAGLALSTIF